MLTNGREWHFYLPSGQGEYQERGVYKLDLVERDPRDGASRFQRYLEFDRVRNGTAREALEEDYRDIRRLAEIRRSLPDAWNRLVTDEDELLVELVADKAADLCGYKPDPDLVVAFLKGMLRHAPTAVAVDSGGPPATNATAPLQPIANAANQRLGFVGRNGFVACNSAKSVMVGVLQYLEDSGPGFLERFAALPRHGRIRRYVSRNRSELYPGRPDLVAECSVEVKPGWWLGTNYSRGHIGKIIQLACSVAGVPVAALSVNVGD